MIVYVVAVVTIVRRQFAKLIDKEEPRLLVRTRTGKTKVRGYDALNYDEDEILV